MSTDLIAARQTDVIDEFALFDDWMDKYEHLIELGKDVPAIDTGRKTDEHLIKGCQSRVWLAADAEAAERAALGCGDGSDGRRRVRAAAADGVAEVGAARVSGADGGEGRVGVAGGRVGVE